MPVTAFIVWCYAWRVGRAVGRAWRWCSTSWRALVMRLALVATAVWGAEWLLWHALPATARDRLLERFDASGSKYARWTFWRVVFPVYVLSVVVTWIRDTRRRIVIDRFVDHTAKSTSDKDDPDHRGLATLLGVQLARLRDLYLDVDDERAIPSGATLDSPVDATIRADDSADAVKGAVASDATVMLGPVKVPLGGLISLASRIAQGPRIVGSIHEDAGRRIVTAQLLRRGGAATLTWRVDIDVSAAVRTWDDAVYELACRIFADISMTGSVRWKATARFSEGLRTYRECLRTPGERRVKLKEAELAFVAAVADDERFDLGFYNLGVVYTEQDQPLAAARAFGRALEQAPTNWMHYYALATNRFDQRKHVDAVGLCTQGLSLAPGHAARARLLDLRGLARRQRVDADAGGSPLGLRGGPRPAGGDQPWRRALADHRAAVRSAFRNLAGAVCRVPGSERARRAVASAEQLASNCLRNFAAAAVAAAADDGGADDGGAAPDVRSDRRSLASRLAGRFRSWTAAEALIRGGLRKERCQRFRWLATARAALREALVVTPADPAVFAERARVSYAAGDVRAADADFMLVTRISPSRAEMWAYRCHLPCRGDVDGERREWRRFLQGASTADRAAIRRTARDLARWGNQSLADRVDAVATVLDAVDEVERRGRGYVRKLTALLAGASSRDQHWVRGQLHYALARACLCWELEPQAGRHVAAAIDEFEADGLGGEVEHRGLHAMLAYADPGAAANRGLARPQDVVRDNPMDGHAHRYAGLVALRRGDFDAARNSFTAAFTWDPATVANYLNLAVLEKQVADRALDPAVARSHLAASVDQFRRALQAIELFDSGQRERVGEILHWLGRAHGELGDVPRATDCLAMARATGFAPSVSRYLAAAHYARVGRFNEAEAELAGVIRACARVRRRRDWGRVADPHAELGYTARELYVRACAGCAELAMQRSGAGDLTRVDALLGKAARHAAECGRGTRGLLSAIGGWRDFHAHRLGDAVRKLGAAVALDSHPRHYVRLAGVLERMARRAGAPSNEAPAPGVAAAATEGKIQLLTRARECLRTAARRDTFGLYADEVRVVDDRIGDAVPPLKPAATVAGTGADGAASPAASPGAH